MKLVAWLLLLLAPLAAADELTLQQAIDLALRDNAGMKMTVQRIKAADGQLAAARGQLVPQLSATGSILRLNSLIGMDAFSYPLPVLDSNNVPTGYHVPMTSASISSDNIGNAYSAKLSASWPIYTGGRIWQGYQISRLNRQAADWSADSARAEVILAVKKAYYGLLLAQSAHRVTQEAVSSIEKHVDRVRALYQKGMVSRYDLLRAEVQLSNMQPQLIRMSNAVQLSRQHFNMTLNRDPGAEVSLLDSMEFREVETDSASLLQKALESRPEFQSLRLRQQMVDRAKLISYASYQPTVALIADYSYSKGSGFASGEEWNKNWDLGVAASWPLFDGGTGLGRIKEARANAGQLALAREMLEDGIRLEVTSIYLTLQASQKAVLSQQRSVEQAQEALKIAQVRYGNGQATNLDVLDAQLALTQAQTNSIQAVHDYLIGLAMLEKAIGHPAR